MKLKVFLLGLAVLLLCACSEKKDPILSGMCETQIGVINLDNYKSKLVGEHLEIELEEGSVLYIDLSRCVVGRVSAAQK